MVADLLIDLVVALVSPLLGLLPEIDLEPVTAGVTSAATTVGAWAMQANGVLPVSEFLVVLGALALLMPVVIAYKVFSWVWRHVPTVAGFGTGNG